MEQMPPGPPGKSKLSGKQVLIVLAASVWPGITAAILTAMDADGPLVFALAALLVMPVSFGVVIHLSKQRPSPLPGRGNGREGGAYPEVRRGDIDLAVGCRVVRGISSAGGVGGSGDSSPGMRGTSSLQDCWNVR